MTRSNIPSVSQPPVRVRSHEPLPSYNRHRTSRKTIHHLRDEHGELVAVLVQLYGRSLVGFTEALLHVGSQDVYYNVSYL